MEHIDNNLDPDLMKINERKHTFPNYRIIQLNFSTFSRGV